MGGEEVLNAGNGSGVEIVLAEPAPLISKVEGCRLDRGKEKGIEIKFEPRVQ